GVSGASSTGSTSPNFFRCSIGRRGTISAVPGRSSGSGAAGACGLGSIVTEARASARCRSLTAITGGFDGADCRRDHQGRPGAPDPPAAPPDRPRGADDLRPRQGGNDRDAG